MIKELQRIWRGSSYLIKVLSEYSCGGIEEKYENFIQNNQCLGPGYKRRTSENNSEALWI
jgi:hypothetical protein